MGRERRPVAAGLAAALLLAACHGKQPEPPPAPATASASACRSGPDGGPILAERGIGGTGGPAYAERGIGGTGSPVLADRGIGGTGIIGVITGFASVCLAGQEVALAPATPVTLESEQADGRALRVGQVAAVEAVDTAGGLQARRVTVRFEVIGSVEAADAGMLRVAGQRVRLSPQTLGTRPQLGDVVAVSGLRHADGTIEATRIEPHQPGPALIHGRITEQAGGLRLGALRLEPDPAAQQMVGRDVTVLGTILGQDELIVDSITPDLLASDPADYFGPGIGVVLIEAFAVSKAGRLAIGPFSAGVAPGFRLGAPGRGVFRLERRGRDIVAVGADGRTAPSAGQGPASPAYAPAFEPAPVPNPAFGAGRFGPAGGGATFGRGGFTPGRTEFSPFGAARPPGGDRRPDPR